MNAARSHSGRQALDALRAWWLPIGSDDGPAPPLRDDAGMDRAYQAERRALHAASRNYP